MGYKEFDGVCSPSPFYVCVSSPAVALSRQPGRTSDRVGIPTALNVSNLSSLSTSVRGYIAAPVAVFHKLDSPHGIQVRATPAIRDGQRKDVHICERKRDVMLRITLFRARLHARHVERRRGLDRPPARGGRSRRAQEFPKE